MAGSTHRILCELAALYLRTRWYIWPVAIEPMGLNKSEKRNYDVVGIQSRRPQGIIAVESKATYDDFRAGIKKGQFKQSPYITDLYLAYPGNFDISELPKHVGVLKIRSEPICIAHELQNRTNLCTEKCKNKKNIFYTIEKQCQSWYTIAQKSEVYNNYKNDWLWSIAVSNSTKLLGHIEANVLWDDNE